MDTTFFYFGIKTKKVIKTATGTPREKELTIFNPKAYTSYEAMAKEKADAERTRPGVSFFWQQYPKELNIDKQGISHGFKA